jgi:hypothetical protein
MNSSCRVLTDTADDSSALTSLDDRSGEKEWILLVLVDVRALSDFFSFRIFDSWFIDLQVLGFNDEGVCWNTGTGLKQYNITYDDIPNTNALSSTELATDDWNILLFNVFGKLNVLLILLEISYSDQGHQEDGDQDDGDSFPGGFPFSKAQGNHS